MGSAAKVEIGGNYVNAQEYVPIRTSLIELNHP